MSHYLSSLGFEVDCAEQVDEAEALLAGGCYRLVIADLRLAGAGDLGGLEVIRSARLKCPGTRVIVLTAHRSKEVEAKARDYGIDAFLQKPKPLAQIAQVLFGLVGAGTE